MCELQVVVPYKKIWLGPNLEKKIGVNQSGYRIHMGKAASAFYCQFRATVD